MIYFINLNIVFALLILFVTPFKVHGTSKNFYSDYQEDLKKINTNIVQPKNTIIDFIETNSKGEKLSGTLYAKKPNSVAIDYQKGNVKAKIVVTKDNITIYDKELKQSSTTKNNNNPIFILLTSGLSSKDIKIKIKKAYKIKDKIIIHTTIMSTARMVLTFSSHNFVLEEILTSPKTGNRKNQISIISYKTDQEIPDKIFQIAPSINKKYETYK